VNSSRKGKLPSGKTPSGNFVDHRGNYTTRLRYATSVSSTAVATRERIAQMLVQITHIQKPWWNEPAVPLVVWWTKEENHGFILFLVENSLHCYGIEKCLVEIFKAICLNLERSLDWTWRVIWDCFNNPQWNEELERMKWNEDQLSR
jgi:hypothetical protein